MQITYYEDEHNRDLVRGVLVEFDSLRVHSMLQALPSAMLALMNELPRLPESESSDFEADEQHRKALNQVIQLADLLMEMLDLVMTRQTTTDHRMLEPYYWEATSALLKLQKCKEARIAITHRDLGCNFGSKTGFQEVSYGDFARKTASWLTGRLKQRSAPA